MALLARPTALTALAGVAPAAGEQLSWVVQMLGARELALGVGSVVALRNTDRRVARTWLAAGLLCDAVDAVALLLAVRAGRAGAVPGLVVVGIATGAVAVQATALLGRD